MRARGGHTGDQHREGEPRRAAKARCEAGQHEDAGHDADVDAQHEPGTARLRIEVAGRDLIEHCREEKLQGALGRKAPVRDELECQA